MAHFHMVSTFYFHLFGHLNRGHTILYLRFESLTFFCIPNVCIKILVMMFQSEIKEAHHYRIYSHMSAFSNIILLNFSRFSFIFLIIFIIFISYHLYLYSYDICHSIKLNFEWLSSLVLNFLNKKIGTINWIPPDYQFQ